MKIPFNKPHLTGKEMHYIYDAVNSGKISGNGKYTNLCHDFFENKYGFKKCLLTSSCTDALEMCAILLNIQIGDEVILPSFTFVSTANAFVLRGAKLVFGDSESNNPNMDATALEKLISPKTKAIVVVHYAGISCDMDQIMKIANKHNLFVVEDAAQAIDSYYHNQPLGGIGHLGVFSFHETKNIISGEGGMLVINDERFIKRAEVIWEKGTNRSSFFRGEIDKYSWVDIGSSFLPSEVTSAFLFAQLENLNNIQNKRKKIWNKYYESFSEIKNFKYDLPNIPSFTSNNAHLFYLICNSLESRTKLIEKLKDYGIWAVFHYLPLHDSIYFNEKHDGRQLLNTVRFSNCLVRLPLYYDLSEDEQAFIIESVIKINNLND